MGGKGMPEHMRRDRGANVGAARMALDPVPEGLPRHRRAAPAGEQDLARWRAQQLATSVAQIALQPVQRFFADGQQTLLAPFAQDAQHPLIEADLIQRQPDQLGHAQPAGIQHFQHAAIAQAQGVVRIGRAEQRFDIALGQRVRQGAPLLRPVQFQGGVIGAPSLAQQIAVKITQTGQGAGHRARRAALGEVLAEIRLQVGARQSIRGVALRSGPARQRLQIATIGGQRILAQPALHPQRVQDALDQSLVRGADLGGAAGLIRAAIPTSAADIIRAAIAAGAAISAGTAIPAGATIPAGAAAPASVAAAATGGPRRSRRGGLGARCVFQRSFSLMRADLPERSRR